MSEVFGYYVIVPAFAWLIVVLVALTFFGAGVVLGYLWGSNRVRQESYPAAHRIPPVPSRFPEEWMRQ